MAPSERPGGGAPSGGGEAPGPVGNHGDTGWTEPEVVAAELLRVVTALIATPGLARDQVLRWSRSAARAAERAKQSADSAVPRLRDLEREIRSALDSRRR